MDVCKVKGNVVSTNKCEKLMGLKLMLVRQFNLEKQKEEGNPFVAIDTVGSGEGEVVLVVKGSSARQTQITENRPVDSSIVGIIDLIEVEGKTVFRKYK